MGTRVSAGIELAFDDQTEQRIRDVWSRLHQAGVASMAGETHGQHRPHLTVIVADWLEISTVREAIAPVARWTPVPVEFRSVGVFPTGPVWLGPVVTAELLQRHRSIHTVLDAAGISGWEYYRPGRWVPHSTVTMRATDGELADAVRIASEELPIVGRLVAADLVRHTTDSAEYHRLTEPW